MLRNASLIVTVAATFACQQGARDGSESGAAAGPTPAPSGPETPSAPPRTSTGVQITLDRTTYAPRGDVAMTLANNSARDLGYNACTRVVERESGGAWSAVPEPERICTMELRLLARGATVKEQTDLPPVSAGHYRIAINFSDQGASAGAPVRGVSGTFEVR